MTNDSQLALDNFTTFRRDRFHSRGGGLLVYVRNTLHPIRKPALEHPNTEYIAVEFSTIQLGKCLLLYCYRSPNFPSSTYFQALSEKLALATGYSMILLFRGVAIGGSGGSDEPPTGRKRSAKIVFFFFFFLSGSHRKASSLKRTKGRRQQKTSHARRGMHGQVNVPVRILMALCPNA